MQFDYREGPVLVPHRWLSNNGEKCAWPSVNKTNLSEFMSFEVRRCATPSTGLYRKRWCETLWVGLGGE